MIECPVCGALLDPDREMPVEQETYVGTEGVPGELIIRLSYCGVQRNCNRITAANKLDELARPFLEAVGNG